VLTLAVVPGDILAAVTISSIVIMPSIVVLMDGWMDG